MKNMSHFCRFKLLAIMLGLSVFMTAPVMAAEAAPDPIVLVLKLVSDTLVQPTTGVVVSADGTVVVYADFINEGDEIVVMDGGTDITKHARPAHLLSKSDISGLALLSVPDMRRPAIRFAQLISPSDGDLHYSAFPEAQRIAEGGQPLWLPVDVAPSPMQGEWFVTNVDTLPSISGLVLDNCGQLAGFALPSYPPSPYQGQARMIMGGRLVASLKQMDVSLSSVFCDTRPLSQRMAEEAAQQNEPVNNVVAAPAKRQPPPKVIKESPIDQMHQLPGNDAALPSGDQEQTGDGKQVSGEVQPAPSIWSLVPIWLWVLIGVLLAALIFKLGTLWRLVNRSPEPTSQIGPRQAPVVEPPTVELLAGSSVRQRNTQFANQPIPDINALPEGFNAIVSVVGEFSNGKSFARYCSVDKSHIDIIIGRGDVNVDGVDISIESPAVSRQHVRLKGTATALTLSDLGSGNGTFIGNVPCLQGEIMFIEPNDEVTLADVRFRIGVRVRVVRQS